MKKFSNIKPEDDKFKKDVILYEDDSVKLIKYEEWSILSGKDCVICIPYLINLNKFIIRQEYIPSYKYDDGQQQHLACVGGGIEMGETPEVALTRELQEEAGIVLRDGFKINLESPLFFMKGSSMKFYYCILALTENDYHEISIMGDGSLVEKMSQTAKVDVKYLSQLRPSDVITEFMISKLREYLSL